MNDEELHRCNGCRKPFHKKWLFFAHDGFGVLCGECFREYRDGLIGDMNHKKQESKE